MARLRSAWLISPQPSVDRGDKPSDIKVGKPNGKKGDVKMTFVKSFGLVPRDAKFSPRAVVEAESSKRCASKSSFENTTQ